MTTIADLQTRFPELAIIGVVNLQMYIDDAELLTGTCFGKFRDLAVAFLSMHLFAVGMNSATGNMSSQKDIASESVGSVSVSYVASKSTSDNSSTTYGKSFDDLRRKVCIGGVLIG